MSNQFNNRWCSGWNYDGPKENCTACGLLYTGDRCDIDLLQEDLPYVFALLTYQIGFIAFYFLYVLWCIIGLIAKWRTGRSKWNSIYSFVIYLCILSSMMRCVYLLDPHEAYGYLNIYFYDFCRNFAIVLFVLSIFLASAMFYDIAIGVIGNSKFNFMIAKTVTVIIASVSFVVVFILTVLSEIFGVSFARTLLDVYKYSWFVLILVLNFGVIPKLSKLNKIAKSKDVERV